jgi:hypothetical protein
MLEQTLTCVLCYEEKTETFHGCGKADCDEEDEPYAVCLDCCAGPFGGLMSWAIGLRKNDVTKLCSKCGKSGLERRDEGYWLNELNMVAICLNCRPMPEESKMQKKAKEISKQIKAQMRAACTKNDVKKAGSIAYAKKEQVVVKRSDTLDINDDDLYEKEDEYEDDFEDKDLYEEAKPVIVEKIVKTSIVVNTSKAEKYIQKCSLGHGLEKLYDGQGECFICAEDTTGAIVFRCEREDCSVREDVSCAKCVADPFQNLLEHITRSIDPSKDARQCARCSAAHIEARPEGYWISP